MKEMKKVFAIILVAVMMVTVVGSAMASEPVSAETVKEVQQALNDAGFNCGTPDGVAGNNTKNAISEYQQSNGMTVTGEIDDELLEALFPQEDSEEAEKAAVETEVASEKEDTETESLETEAIKSGTEATTLSDGKFHMDPGDAMYYKCVDGVKVKLHIEGEEAIVEIVEEGGEEVEPREIARYGSYEVNFANYIAEKYVATARAELEGTEIREITETYEDVAEKPDLSFEEPLFSWERFNGSITYSYNDGTEYLVFYHEDVNGIRVMLYKGKESKIIFDFPDDHAKLDETARFIDKIFIRARIYDDPDFLYEME